MLVIDHSVSAAHCLLGKLSPVLRYSGLIATFFSIRFSVTRFVLRFLTRLYLSFVSSAINK